MNDNNELSIIIEKIYDKLKHKIKYLKFKSNIK